MSAPGDMEGWLHAYAWGLPNGVKGLIEQLTKWSQNQTLRHQDEKPNARVTYTEGPMLYIGQQICKRMAKMGYPAKIAVHWRSAEQQNKEFVEGDSKAKAWQSPHQFGEAVDIVHKTLGWSVPDEFWAALSVCVRIIEAELRVSLVHGRTWGWDQAHVELKDWRTVRDAQKARGALFYHKPTQDELLTRWKQVLPGIRIPV